MDRAQMQLNVADSCAAKSGQNIKPVALPKARERFMFTKLRLLSFVAIKVSATCNPERLVRRECESLGIGMRRSLESNVESSGNVACRIEKLLMEYDCIYYHEL